MALKTPFQPPRPGDLPGCARRTLESRIEAVEKGVLHLRIPRLKDQMRNIGGMHFHLVPEVFIQLSGLTDFRFPHERCRLLPQEVCIVPRGMPHAETVRAFRGPFYNLVFLAQKQQCAFHLARESRPGQPGGVEFRNLKHPAIPRIWQYLDDLVEAFHSESAGRERTLKGLLLAFFSSLLTALSNDQIPSQEEPFKVAQARQLALRHLADPGLSVCQLGGWVRCTPDYLSHLFHRATGTPLTRFINEQRLDQARHLLEESTLNIKEIASAVGYEDPGYFTRLFRKSTGRTPREHRRQLRKGA